MKIQKHETLEAGAALGSAEEITAVLKKSSTQVEQMLALQELGLEVLPIQGARPVERPWEKSTEDKRWEKLPGGRPMNHKEWVAFDLTEAERLGEASLEKRKSRRKDGSPKKWHHYGTRNPLEFYANEDALKFLEDRYHGAGVLFQSGLIGLDADTPEEVQWLREWMDVDAVPFTVKTPGKVALGEDGDPAWNHSEGGHVWIRMPDGWDQKLPARAKERVTVENGYGTGFDVKRGGGYFIAPGSTRSEGAYELVGEVLDAEEFPGLVEKVIEAFTPPGTPEPKSITFAPGTGDTVDRLAQWSENRPWSSIINDMGWSWETSACGHECVSFTYPGSSSGSHSGVAHGKGCTDSNNPVADSIKFWSSTAIAGLNLHQTTLTKYRFVLDHLYAGVTDSFFVMEPVTDTRDHTASKTRQEASRAPLESPKGKSSSRDHEETAGAHRGSLEGLPSEEELLPSAVKVGEENEKTQEDQKPKAFQALMDATQLRMEVRQSVSGFSYLPITSEGVVGIDQGEEWAIDSIRNAREGQPPASEAMAKSVISRMKYEARRAVAEQGTPKADETPRFWSEAAENDLEKPTFIYRGRSDWGRTAPFYAITVKGCEESTGGEADAVFLEREDYGPLEADLSASISELEGLWSYLNVPVQSRSMVLGALITAWVSPKATRPILFASGPTSTGKTLTTERLAALIDPKTGGETSVSTTGSGEPIHQAGLGNETLVIGNISRISRQASDALAQIGGSSTKVERTLYKNGRNSAYVIRSTAILSTKETGMVLQDDLLNRMIPILPQALTSAQKKRGTMTQKWEEALPRFRGALMKLVAEVKRDAVENPDRPFSRVYRWQTVGEVIERVEVVLSRHGMEPTQPWAEVLRSELHALKGDSLPPIIEWIRDELDRKLSGSPTQVFKKLVEGAGGKGSPGVSGWVESARGFNTVLKEYADILDGEGVEVEIEDRYPGTANRAKLVTIIPRENGRDDDYDYEEAVEDVF